MLLIFIKLKKLHFRPILDQKRQYKMFPKKMISVKFNSICNCNFMQTNPEKSQALNFDKTPNNLFWAHFGSLLGLKTQSNIFIQKIL